MPYLRRFKKLLETELTDVVRPDYMWLTYAVCAVSRDACGWGGWIIEGVFQIRPHGNDQPRTDIVLNANEQQICPICGEVVYRTGASLRFEPSLDQTHTWAQPGIDYDIAPMEWED